MESQRKFENLLVWQRSVLLTKKIYFHFNVSDDFGFRNQIQRAAISISNNIAEGFDRKSDREFKRYLSIALGSLSEVKSMVIIAFHLNYINEEVQQELIAQIDTIGKMTNSLINFLTKELAKNK
jgi:four helix bundle protein